MIDAGRLDCIEVHIPARKGVLDFKNADLP